MYEQETGRNDNNSQYNLNPYGQAPKAITSLIVIIFFSLLLRFIFNILIMRVFGRDIIGQIFGQLFFTHNIYRFIG